jgi:hypothetical protein
VLAPCFRDYQATGTERHGWRALIEGKDVPEVVGVLVAPVGALWRARVITYPNVVWMVPGGGSSMKFLGASAAQAESDAVLYLQEYLKSKGLKVSRRLPNLVTGEVDREESAETQADQQLQAARRRVQYIPVWWGLEIPDEEGLSEDLSETGLFLITGKLQPKGARLALRIDAAGTKVDMLGTVAWRREMLAGGRRVGMGIEIRTPPAAYVEYVRSLP